jgi:hypothetical protein
LPDRAAGQRILGVKSIDGATGLSVQERTVAKIVPGPVRIMAAPRSRTAPPCWRNARNQPDSLQQSTDLHAQVVRYYRVACAKR